MLNVCDEEAAAPAAVLERLVVAEGARVGVEAAAAVELAPGSAKIVPNDGTKVEAEQQLPSYAQHHDPLFDAALHAITFTNVLFPAVRRIQVNLPHRIKFSQRNWDSDLQFVSAKQYFGHEGFNQAVSVQAPR